MAFSASCTWNTLSLIGNLLWVWKAWCITVQLPVHKPKLHLPYLWDVIEKRGELNACKAATSTQSYSRHSSCMSTKHPHCLSNCLIQSKHNLLSASLQLKCIKLVEGHLHSKYVIQYETLCWNMVVTHFCFSCLRTPFTFFVLPAKIIHKSFSPWSLSLPVFQTPGHKETWSVSVRTKALGAQPWYTSGETAHPSWGKKGQQQEAGRQSIISRLYSPVRSIYISKFVLVSKHGCLWLLNVAALCKQALGTLRRGWPLRIHILPLHLRAFSGLFFKSFQGFFL